MTDDAGGRGGYRENAGRPPAENPRNVSFPIRLTQDERDKLARLGGAAWIRERIKLAKDPEPPAPRRTKGRA